MARTEIIVSDIPRAGLGIAYTAMDLINGSQINPSQSGRGSAIVCFFRTSLPSVVITIKAGPNVDDDLVVADRTLIISAGQEYLWMMKNTSLYTKPNGLVAIDASANCDAAFYKF